VAILYGDHLADWLADVTRGINYLYVYFLLVEPRMVGDAQVPLPVVYHLS
jgi:hypothetical protein